MQMRLTLLCSILLTSMSTSPAFAQGGETLVELVRDATDRFKDVSVAQSEGYTPKPCVSGPNGGAMGVHDVNAEYSVHDEIDVARPRALMYEPRPGGEMELVGAEFITFHGPTVLEGHLFHHVGAPNRYGLDPFCQLHVWTWRENPRGVLADFNPAVSCREQQADA